MQLMCFVVTFSLGPRILGAAGLGGLGSFLLLGVLCRTMVMIFDCGWGAAKSLGHLTLTRMRQVSEVS